MVIKTSASIAAASAQEDVDLDHGLNVAGVQAEVAGATTPCSRDSLPTPEASALAGLITGDPRVATRGPLRAE